MSQEILEPIRKPPRRPPQTEKAEEREGFPDRQLEVPEGRAFFIILAFLVGVGVMMTVASLGILVVAALSF